MYDIAYYQFERFYCISTKAINEKNSNYTFKTMVVQNMHLEKKKNYFYKIVMHITLFPFI